MVVDDSFNFHSPYLSIIFAFKWFMIVDNSWQIHAMRSLHCKQIWCGLRSEISVWSRSCELNRLKQPTRKWWKWSSRHSAKFWRLLCTVWARFWQKTKLLDLKTKDKTINCSLKRQKLIGDIKYTEKNILNLHVCYYSFSPGWISLYNSAVCIININIDI